LAENVCILNPERQRGKGCLSIKGDMKLIDKPLIYILFQKNKDSNEVKIVQVYALKERCQEAFKAMQVYSKPEDRFFFYWEEYEVTA
jgi:hypothetical protein